jgi:hypothetical protein
MMPFRDAFEVSAFSPQAALGRHRSQPRINFALSQEAAVYAQQMTSAANDRKANRTLP